LEPLFFFFPSDAEQEALRVIFSQFLIPLRFPGFSVWSLILEAYTQELHRIGPEFSISAL